mmetsp:Transcript_14874/g.22880  ORF Transcript_14874/g.22880 Transcript_14874/m.22880 type:complete len:338 (-) Transcript_14874:53-1066(-)
MAFPTTTGYHHSEKLLSTISHLVDDDILEQVQSLLLNNDDDDLTEFSDDSTRPITKQYYSEIPNDIQSPTGRTLATLPMELLDVLLSYCTIKEVATFTLTCRYYHYPRDHRFLPQAIQNTYKSTDAGNDDAVLEKLASIMEHPTKHICSKSLSWLLQACHGGDGIFTKPIFWVHRYFFNAQGRTLLSIAAREGHTKAVRAILDYTSGVYYINQVNYDGSTPLHQAAAQGHVDIVKLLVEQSSINVNAIREKDGATPLYLAAIHGHVRVVQLLVESGKADMTIPTKLVHKTYTPLWGAAYFGQEEVVKQLVALGATRTIGDDNDALALLAEKNSTKLL